MFYQCPACREVMEDLSEPCWCVFDAPTVDENGFVRTPARVQVDANVLAVELDAQDAVKYIAWAKLPNAIRYDRPEYYEEDEHALAFSYLLR